MDQKLAFGYARSCTYSSRLSGWRLSGRYERCIPLRCILQVDAPDSERLLLWLVDGRVLRLRLNETPRWEQAIDWHLEDDEHR